MKPLEMSAAEFQALARKGKLGGKKDPWIRRAKPEDRTEDGIGFASVAELSRYRELKALRAARKVLWWCRQPVFDLGGVEYRPDFLVGWAARPDTAKDGECWRYPFPEETRALNYGPHLVTVEEVKGKRAPPETIRRWKRNAAQMQALWGLRVEVILR
jgi:hypothetical protein